MALSDVKDPIENNDYLFISSFRNGSHSHCRHQLLSSNDSLVLKVTPGANLTIYNKQCHQASQADIKTNQHILRMGGHAGPGFGEEDTEENKTSGATTKKKHHTFTIAPGKKNWILIGPIGGAVGFLILSLAILTFCCWKKRREVRNDKRNTWHEEIYFDLASPSAKSSVRSKLDFNTSFHQ